MSERNRAGENSTLTHVLNITQNTILYIIRLVIILRLAINDQSILA